MPPIQLKLPKAGMMCSMSLTEYSRFCCTGRLPESVARVSAKGEIEAALVCWADLLGFLEPACATRPDACEPEIKSLRFIELAPATLNADGTITPTEERAISICAPMNKALMVDQLEVTPENLTAETQPVTMPIFKRVNIATFPDGWCLPFDPPDQPGLFANVQHIMVPPAAGFSVYVQNHNPFSPATYRVRSRLWACC